MYTLKNEQLTIKINPKGAELVSVYGADYEYLWQGDTAFWGRTSPVLFPIVGRLAKNTYFVDGVAYELPQHGFARDMDFECISQTDDEIWFALKATEETLAKYPFAFELRIGYRLLIQKVEVLWEVENHGTSEMPFSIGAHPAFNAGEELADYALQMATHKDIETRFIDNGRFVEVLDGPEQIIEGLPFLPLNKDFFEEYPTLMIEDETEVTLRSYYHDREVDVNFDGFPLVAFWSPINVAGEVAPFVCIEPWYGLSDTSEKPGELMDKLGIEVLESEKVFKTSYTMTFR